MKRYKLLKDWNGFKAGSIVDIDPESADIETLKSSGVIEDHDPEADARQKARREAEDERITNIVKAAMKELNLGNGGGNGSPDVQVGASPEDKMKFKGIGDQLNAIYLADTHRHEESQTRIDACIKVASAQGLNEAVDSEGGFLVQTDIQAELQELAFQTGVLVGQAERVPISSASNALEWMAVNDFNRTAGNRRGGLSVRRTHEATSTTASKPTFEKRRLVLEKLGGHYVATEELLQDVPALTTMVGRWFGEEFGFVMDDEMIRGSGAGEMLGILNAGALVTVAAVGGQDATTIVSENVENMFARMWAPSIGARRARWYINQDIWPQLIQMQHTVGTGGLPVFLPPNGLADAPFGTLLGLPLVALEQTSTLGTVGDIILADWSQYKVIEKGGIQAASSIHVRFLQNETTFKFTVRNNGEPNWRTVLTPANGSNTQSPFIALATRS